MTNNCIGGASCQRGICTCPYLTHANQDYTECIPDRSLDEDCLNDRECVTSASQCYDGFCKCTDGYVPSENRSNCLKSKYQVSDMEGLCYKFRVGIHLFHCICTIPFQRLIGYTTVARKQFSVNQYRTLSVTQSPNQTKDSASVDHISTTSIM